ncbi:hypothetical protein JQ615_01045 [Bradyrhizobium jicamae]|uniref:Uncharacterized protein n=1 Tax=Bradyrhizobium jicamae TaxID=280332 RepID=A0ABS5FB08_9BRAD|nr:hypothetical protein [Bradyrhizobium jicamae]MBR0793967.1 hypothetical protein [Bradyrhizobium jicamae]
MPKRDFTHLPYGGYIVGRETILFNRRYQPIVRIAPAAFRCHGQNRAPLVIPVGPSTVTPCDPGERITFDSQVWFYTDANPPSRNMATRARLQQLVDDIPELRAEIERRESKVTQ